MRTSLIPRLLPRFLDHKAGEGPLGMSYVRTWLQLNCVQQYTFSGSLAKKISSTVAVLMAEARKLEASCDEPTLKNEIILSLKVRMSSK